LDGRITILGCRFWPKLFENTVFNLAMPYHTQVELWQHVKDTVVNAAEVTVQKECPEGQKLDLQRDL